jgi:hypothetical protein
MAYGQKGTTNVIACPRCGGVRVYREERRLKCYDGFYWCGWYACLNPKCWYKWDGVCEDPGGLPAGVVERQGITQ